MPLDMGCINVTYIVAYHFTYKNSLAEMIPQTVTKDDIMLSPF